MNASTKKQVKKASQHRLRAKKGAPAARKSTDPQHWILVANHKKAHVYRKSPQGIERVPDEHLHCALPLSCDNACEEAFLRDLACWLDAAEKEQAFDRIAFIASAAALEALHNMVGERVHGRICAALEHDVEEITENEIEDHLAEVVWL
jgi:hypothetical protein